MRCILPQSSGSLGTLPDPVAGPGEALIDVRATALNRADLLQLWGLYPPPPGESPVPGLECAGVVAELGPGVSSLAVGERVMALLAGGGHATRVAAPEGQVMPIPERLSFCQAAALPEVGLTAFTNLVVEGALARGQSVLVAGAASGVGTFAVQVARELGARVLVAGRDLDRLERLRSFGASGSCVLGPDLAERVRELNSGHGVDLVLDLVGGPWLGACLGALRERGRLVLVGLTAGARSDLDLGLLLRRRLRVFGSVLRSRSRAEKAGLVKGFWDFAAERLASGRLQPVVDRVLPFEELPRAYAELEAGGVLGKIVIEVPPGRDC